MEKEYQYEIENINKILNDFSKCNNSDTFDYWQNGNKKKQNLLDDIKRPK